LNLLPVEYKYYDNKEVQRRLDTIDIIRKRNGGGELEDHTQVEGINQSVGVIMVVITVAIWGLFIWGSCNPTVSNPAPCNLFFAAPNRVSIDCFKAATASTIPTQTVSGKIGSFSQTC
jgi:hypothetical protein